MKCWYRCNELFGNEWFKGELFQDGNSISFDSKNAKGLWDRKHFVEIPEARIRFECDYIWVSGYVRQGKAVAGTESTYRRINVDVRFIKPRGRGDR